MIDPIASIEDIVRVVIAPNLFSDTGEQNVFFTTKDGKEHRRAFPNTDGTQWVYNYFRERGFVTKPSNSPLVIILEPEYAV